MPQGDLILDETNRAKLDDIVSKMTANKESDDDIQFVVNDFKTKYGTSPKPTTSPQGAESGVPKFVSTPYIAPKTILPQPTSPSTSESGSTSLVGGKSSPYAVTIKNAEDKRTLNTPNSKTPQEYAKVVNGYNNLIADTDKSLSGLADKVKFIENKEKEINSNVIIPSLHPEAEAEKNRLYNEKINAIQEYNKTLASRQAFEQGKAKVQGVITDKERELVKERIEMPFVANFFQALHQGNEEVIQGLKNMGLDDLIPAYMNPSVIDPKDMVNEVETLAKDKKKLIQSLEENAIIDESKVVAENEKRAELGEAPVRSYLGSTLGGLTAPILLAAGTAVTGTEGALPAMNGAFFGTMGYGASLAQGYNEARQLGYSEEESYELAKNAARIGGTVQGVLGVVMGKTGEAMGGLNPFNKAITGDISKNAIKQGITDFGLKAVGTGTEFAAARLAENIGQKYLNPEVSDEKDVTEGVGESFGQGVLLHTTMSAMHAPKQILGKASLINAVNEAKTPEDILELTNTIQQAKDSKIITEGMATQLTQKVGRVKEAIDIVPDQFTDADVREKATELILRHQDVEEKLKKTPEALKPMVADELKAINVQFEELRNEQLGKKNKIEAEDKPKPSDKIDYSESEVTQNYIAGLENEIASEIKYKGENKPKGVFAKIANFFTEDNYEAELKSELQAFKENPIKALEERIAKLKKYNKENPDDSFNTDYLERDLDELKNYGNRVVEQQVEAASTENGGGVGKDNKGEVAYITNEEGKSKPIELSPTPSEIQLEEAYNELLNQSGEEGKKRIKSIAEIVQEAKDKETAKERVELWKAEVAKARKAFEENQAKPKVQGGEEGVQEPIVQVFNNKKTGVSGVDDLLNDDGYQYFYKGVTADVVEMTPDEYLAKVREGMKSDVDENISDEKKDAIKEAIGKGNKINMPYLSYKNGRFNQEGRNRAMVAKEMGIEKIPVLIEKDVTFDDKINRGKEYVKEAVDKGAKNQKEVIEYLENKDVHRDAIRFIENNYDDISPNPKSQVNEAENLTNEPQIQPIVAENEQGANKDNPALRDVDKNRSLKNADKIDKGDGSHVKNMSMQELKELASDMIANENEYKDKFDDAQGIYTLTTERIEELEIEQYQKKEDNAKSLGDESMSDNYVQVMSENDFLIEHIERYYGKKKDQLSEKQLADAEKYTNDNYKGEGYYNDTMDDFIGDYNDALMSFWGKSESLLSKEQTPQEVINNNNNEANDIQPNSNAPKQPQSIEDVEQREREIADREAAISAEEKRIKAENELAFANKTMPVDNIVVAPDVMQFKAADEESGVNKREKLKGKFDKEVAGAVDVWIDKENELGYGKNAHILVDGHHRMEFAKRSGIKDIEVRYLNAKTAKEARLLGAKRNISQGRGTSIDAAKIYREATPEQLDGFEPSGKVATEGKALANLNDPLFNLVSQEKLDIPTAIAISKVPKELQEAFYKKVKRNEASGAIKMTPKGLLEMADMIVGGNAAAKEVAQMDIFGNTAEQELLVFEQAQLQSDIKEELAKDAKILGSANRNKEVLEKANNILNLEENAKLAQSSKLASGLFDTYKNRKNIAEIIKKATLDLSNTKSRKQRAEIKEKATSEVKKAIEAELENDFNGGKGKEVVVQESRTEKKNEQPSLDNPKNQAELAETLVKKFKRNPILAQAEAKLFDLRADVWSRLTGNSKQDFYDRVSYDTKESKAKGQINFTDKVKGFNNAVISLFNTATAVEFVHEFNHLNFQDMLSMAKDNEQIKADVRTAVEFYNQHAKPSERIKDVDKAVERLMAIDAENHLRDDEYVKVHEAFANGFSEYLKDPNTTNIPQALKEVYEALKQFLGNLAQTIAGTKITITPEMDAVYRRLFEPEFVNNIYETKENYDAEIEAKEFKESPIKDITDKDINDAFNNLDNLFSEEKKSYTPNEIFNAKIAQLKEEGKTDGTIVVEQLKALVDNSTASAENKAKLKEYIDLNADKYIAEAGEMERMRKGVRDILTDNVLDLETKEKLVADKTLATYIKTSFTQLGKTVDEVIGSMSYNDVVANEALILEQIAQNVPSQDIEYANLDFLSKKLKKGYAYLDMMKAEKGADKAKIKQLEDVLYKQLSEALQGGTLAAKRLAAQQMFDVLRPNIMTDAIDRMVREEMNGEKLAEAKELIRVLQERVKKGLENEDVFKGIIEELEMNFGDEKKRNELLAKRNLEMDKELSEIEGRIAKNDKEESETSLPAKVRNVQNRAGNKLKNDAKTYSNARKEILAKIEVLNGLFSGEERSPKELVADYIFNYVAEQQALGGKVIRFNHMVQHFKDLGLDITNEGLAETYEQARQLAIAEGVSRKAMDTPQQVADALQNIEDKAQKAKLKAEKQANQNKTKADNNLDKMLAEALKGGKWDERVTSVDREKSIQEVMDKVKENNPTITPEEEAKIRERLTTLFNEKTDKWTEKELEKIQKKLNPKEKKQISGNFKKLANIINTGVFNKTDVSDLLLSELGLNGLTDIDKNIIEHSISVIQQLLHGDLKNKEIERLSAYITAVTNPTNFITSLAQSKLYMEMLNSVVTSAVNATTLIGSLEKAISKSIMQLDPKYLQIYLQGFNKGMVKSAVEKGYFKTNENYELAQTETGFAPVRMGEYAKYGELLKTKGALGKGQRGYAAWVNFTNKLGSKRLARVNEGVDNLNTLINSNMAAYEYNKKLLKKENPNISKQELNDKIAKKLMPISYEEAEAMAIEQLALVGKQRDAIAKEDRTSPSEIRRVAYDIINNSRDEATKVLMEQEGQRASFRNRLQPFSNGGGFIEGLSAAVQGLFNTAAASVKNNPNMTNKDKAKRIAGIKFAKSILTPFIQTPANLLEAGTHYAVVGGLIKEVSLGLKKRSLKNKQSQDATNRKLGYESSMAKAETQAEKDAITNRYKANEAKTRAIENTDIYAIDQYQKDVAVRMVKGVTMLFLMDMFFKSLQDDDDKEVKSGVYGDDPKNGKYRNTIVINGTRTPIMLTGILAPLMSLYAAKSDYERYINEKKVKEEITDEDEAFQNKMAGTANRFIKGVLKTTPYYGSARVFESIQNTLNEKDDKVSEGLAGIGRIVGNAVGYGLMPIPRPFNDYSAFFYTDTKKPTSFTEGFMAVYNPLNPYITGKVDIDPITGKPVDVRDNRLVSVSGMVKNYLGEGADEVASQLKNHNIGIVPIKKSDFIKDGADMTDNEFYLLQNDIYKEFSTQLKASIDERIKQAKSIADIKISVLPNIKEKDAVTLKRLEADKLLNKEVQEMYKNSIDIVLISKSNILRNNTENREYLFNKKNLKNN